MRGVNPRKLCAIKDRRTKVAALRLQGWTLEAIAAELSTEDRTLSNQVISLDLKAIEAEWQIARLGVIDEMKAIEAARIDHLMSEAYEAYWRSVGQISKLTMRDGSGGKNGPVTEIVETEETQAGDPRYLTIIKDCIEARRKLFGLDAPTKTDNRHEFADHSVDDLKARLARTGYIPPEQRVKRFALNSHSSNGSQNGNGHAENGHPANGNGHSDN